ncbi:HD domain-containing protein [Anaerolinea thermophila]|uniref:HD domain-containing protein n=1 Tax=Anaerolinea thermophila (strain DSM 14523 / JCM 11388 / NBRC 100420 / UNI-1) TaxID=926569 RepID=E8MZG5_ANATU|nr:HD domain-containing protein [Anaerolinea thermophila]BAJ64513.1 hypothetical protein ANT_24870 [Anaerolinea thermophila UNI-1]
MPTIEQARGWYSSADSVHDFDHILRVYQTAQHLGKIEGADMEILHAAVLLHDAIGSAPGEQARKAHHLASAEFAATILRLEGWDDERIAAVQHCIRTHRYRGTGEVPETIEAKILFDADKLDVLGAVGVARVIAYAALNRQPFYAEPSRQFLEQGILEPGEPHSAYHEYLFKLRKIKDRLFTTSARQLAEERDTYLREFFERFAREMRGEA